MPPTPKGVSISNKEIGERVRDVRKARELTQTQLGEILGIPYTNVSAIERGTRGVSLQQLVKLCRALDVSPDEVLSTSAPKKANGSHARLPRRFERMKTLPRTKQQALNELIDTFLARHAA